MVPAWQGGKPPGGNSNSSTNSAAAAPAKNPLPANMTREEFNKVMKGMEKMVKIVKAPTAAAPYGTAAAAGGDEAWAGAGAGQATKKSKGIWPGTGRRSGTGRGGGGGGRAKKVAGRKRPSPGGGSGSGGEDVVSGALKNADASTVRSGDDSEDDTETDVRDAESARNRPSCCVVWMLRRDFILVACCGWMHRIVCGGRMGFIRCSRLDGIDSSYGLLRWDGIQSIVLLFVVVKINFFIYLQGFIRTLAVAVGLTRCFAPLFQRKKLVMLLVDKVPISVNSLHVTFVLLSLAAETKTQREQTISSRSPFWSRTGVADTVCVWNASVPRRIRATTALV